MTTLRHQIWSTRLKMTFKKLVSRTAPATALLGIGVAFAVDDAAHPATAPVASQSAATAFQAATHPAVNKAQDESQDRMIIRGLRP
jgi:hypothetical protein